MSTKRFKKLHFEIKLTKLELRVNLSKLLNNSYRMINICEKYIINFNILTLLE